jgi:ribosomal protein S18 acetylase RimI-like enzyme
VRSLSRRRPDPNPLAAIGGRSLRVVPWRGEHNAVQIGPAPGGPVPTEAGVRDCLRRLVELGYDDAVTPALHRTERGAFEACQFSVRAELVLLARSLTQVPSATDHRLRRPHRSDWDRLVAIDHAAFPPFWRFDRAGVDDALHATPTSRVRVALAGDGDEPVGYAIAGRAGRRGYLQRLAVMPHGQGQGLGRALVVDALTWMAARGADDAMVNTQTDNERALDLYVRLGFERQPDGLAVLGRVLAEL